jgi:hypothetical protein
VAVIPALFMPTAASVAPFLEDCSVRGLLATSSAAIVVLSFSVIVMLEDVLVIVDSVV